ncbi:TolB family protein [Paraburkholderia phytofirmans]|nr:PD40 domain-containing protein [Paraburkholderia phytofirmans]
MPMKNFPQQLAFSVYVTYLLTSTAYATTVSVDRGNIMVVDNNGFARQLTTTGLDASPALSSDKRRVVFVRRTPQKKVITGAGEATADQLWTVNLDGTSPHMLVEGHEGNDPKRTLAALDTPMFSPDGRTVYFTSAAWATSGAIHAIAAAGGKERFVTDGNTLMVVPSGQYAGSLIVNKHKYWLAGGSYNWFWLVTPNGEEKGTVGPDENSIAAFMDMYAK